MKNVYQVKSSLSENLDFLKSKYKVEKVGVFGSVTKGLNTESSDVDILVEFSEPIGFFKFLELEEYLSRVIGVKVDLVTSKALKPAIKEEILKEVVYA